MYRSEHNGPPVWVWTAAIYTAESGSEPARAECATRCEDHQAKRRQKRPLLPLIVKNLFCVFPTLAVYPLILFGLLFLLCGSQFASAQNDTAERLGYGATLHFVRTTHTADFDSLPGIPEAPEKQPFIDAMAPVYEKYVNTPELKAFVERIRAVK